MPADVAILIIAYNSEKQLGPCLRSVLDQRQSVHQQILVLDNASPDNSAALVERDFPEVTLIRSAKNLGFAGGMNFLSKFVNAEFILLLNPDTIILNGSVDTIVEFARTNPGNGIYGGRTLRHDGSLEPSSCWGLPSLYSLFMFATGLSSVFSTNRIFDPESLGDWPRNTTREVGIVTGCFLLITTKLWKSLNGFDERFFMYGEDADLAIRARSVGYRPIICPYATIVHEIGKSSDLPQQKALLLYKGKTTLIRTHWKGISQRLAITLLVLGVTLRAMLPLIRLKSNNTSWSHLLRTRKSWTQGYV